MRLIIDRFEDIYAVCETESGKMINILKSLLPNNVHEGSVLIKTYNGYIADIDEEEKRKAKIKKLENELFQ